MDLLAEYFLLLLETDCLLMVFQINLHHLLILQLPLHY
jgi:hypothetical protein